MASNKKAPWSANVTYWTEGYRCQTSCSMAGVTEMMFRSMPTERREKLLNSLNAAHEQLKEKEAKAAEPAAQ
jgi:hypothetical protein